MKEETQPTTEAEMAQTVKTETAPVESSSNGAGHTAEAEPNLAEQLEQVRQEAAKNLDGWQRAAAELANFKRRQEEQAKLQRDMIKADVLQGVISALDDMDLAFQNLPQELNGQLVGWVEGFRLVQRKLDRVLDEQGVTAISTQGDFNPNLHEAVSHEESPNHQEGQIIGELRKGYQIGNRVIRPALVRVAK
ncbi:MAG: nucleotide exchange factor GrpE [Anaerolineae bacterium]